MSVGQSENLNILRGGYFDVLLSLSVPCKGCHKPSGVLPMVLNANGATQAQCAACAKATAPNDP